MQETGLRHIVFSSTCAIYGTPATIPIAEHCPAAPINPYGASSAALNLVTGRGWSVRELVEVVRRITNREFTVNIGPRRSGDPPALVADASRARETLGWQPRYSDLETLVAHAWAWRQGASRTWKRMLAPAPPASG
jgi:UDP-glucose 4-epimerase